MRSVSAHENRVDLPALSDNVENVKNLNTVGN